MASKGDEADEDDDFFRKVQQEDTVEEDSSRAWTTRDPSSVQYSKWENRESDEVVALKDKCGSLPFLFVPMLLFCSTDTTMRTRFVTGSWEDGPDGEQGQREYKSKYDDDDDDDGAEEEKKVEEDHGITVEVPERLPHETEE